MRRLKTYFATLRCTVLLLMAIALVCIAGTIIPQHAGAPVGGEGLSAWLLARLSPGNIFHSLWLAGLAVLLSLNIVLCMRVRLAVRASGIHAPRFGHDAALSVPGGPHTLKERVLKSAPRFLRFQERQEGSSLLLFGDSSKLRRPALFGLHASVVLIFLGLLVSAFGLDGHIELRQGQTASEYVGADGRAKALGFHVRCDQFLVAHYDNGMPKEYVSRLTFLENGMARASGEVRVNHPLAYQGLRFYQESYYGHPAAVFTVTDGARAWSIRAREGDEMTMDDGRLSFRVAKIGQDVMRMGPALKLEIADASGPRNLWLFQEVDRIKEAIPDLYERAPSFNPALMQPYTFALMEIFPDYATGIGVKRDPGAIIVAAGGVLMLICLLIVFLVPSLKVWIRLEEGGGSTHLKFGASRGGRPGDFPVGWMARIRDEGGA